MHQVLDPVYSRSLLIDRDDVYHQLEALELFHYMDQDDIRTFAASGHWH